ncbi:MAG: thioredoxin domain-containing protein [Candidatus Shapirobacteria bacterium]|nr:thioredoxin domain-containing protein [Candidatus Shapirobacteria bacterium]
MKKIKKIKLPDISKTINSSKSVTIPLVGVIVFCLLLAASSFFAGAAWLKLKSGNSTTTTNKNTFAAVKNNKPEFNFFVMSFCPYGNQIEEVIKPIASLLGNKADIHPHYIFEKVDNLTNYCKQTSGDITQCSAYISAGYFKTESDCQKTINDATKTCLDEKQYLKIGDNFYSSLHGRIEANQDVREICAYNMNDDKTNWWTFIDNVNQNCTAQNADTCWEDQAKKAGFDTAKITECFNTQAADLIEKEIALTTQYKVQGSPTLIINGVDFPPESAYTEAGDGTLTIGNKVIKQADFRSPDAIKEAVCASFKKAPSECKTVLTAATATNNTAAADAASCN